MDLTQDEEKGKEEEKVKERSRSERKKKRKRRGCKQVGDVSILREKTGPWFHVRA